MFDKFGDLRVCDNVKVIVFMKSSISNLIVLVIKFDSRHLKEGSHFSSGKYLVI